jgi:UDP-glucose 4-epimerase
MKVFITGGMGFIGSYIVMDLLTSGHQVTILARNPAKVPEFQTMPGIQIVRGGLDDMPVIAAALPGHEACIHNALYWGNSPTEMLHNDTRSSVHIFAKAADTGVKHLIYTSSTAAMGEFRPGMHEEMKPKPSDYYGATKAATEAYLLAFGSKTSMRCNIVRPGYTIGNPVVSGAHIYSDKRFKQIVASALAGDEIRLTKNDGTQFIWAGDLAKIYTAILGAQVNRSIYFGLSKTWTPWEAIAKQAIDMTKSKSRIVLEDKGYGADPHLFDLGKIEREFGLSFDSTRIITDHLRYLVDLARK